MKQLHWIKSPIAPAEGAAITFRKEFSLSKPIAQATLYVSAVGVYRVFLNGKKQGRQVLTPGFTSYTSRVQYETLDVTASLQAENRLELTVAPGWAVGHIGYDGGKKAWADHMRAACRLELTYTDGTVQTVEGDSSFEVWTHEVTFADIYHGETIDKTYIPELLGNALPDDDQYPLVPQQGADITEQEYIAPVKLIVTPKGERVLDFGQNMTGYVSLRIKGKRGERVVLTHAEVLDKDGNFYNANYRTAQNRLTFVLSGDEDFFKPGYSFQGFRYVRIDEYPEQAIDPNAFRAIVVHSDLTRTGRFACGDAKINQLYHNIIWGHKSNYLDIPTDCPQRDERLGWTGDTQVFCRTAAINYDVRPFFKKWLGDLRAEQEPNGAIWGTCPEKFASDYHTRIATGWGDVCTIVPWTLYEMYGDDSFLSENFEMMRRWVEYMHGAGPEEFLWLGGTHYGDWLAMDADQDSCAGATSTDLIASAFFANSVDLLIRSGEVLGKDMTEYKTLYANIVKAFRSYFMENGMPKETIAAVSDAERAKDKYDIPVKKGMTQTAIVLILHFNLCLPEERKALVDKLEELIHAFGDKMSTGFLGTPYILHVLSENGRSELAYKLFFNEDNPSWLYSVNHGATTMWEHWNSVKEDGSFWSTSMNSFNHYAYGAVADWMYGKICGVTVLEPGYRRVRLSPAPCERLGFAKCGIDTVQGRLESHWYYADGRICFEFTVPNGCEAEIVLPNGQTETVGGGSYCYSVAQ
ncbi:MAG: alfa-L-rhamnosidase [Ruminococcaceae bacterium]|nr:alfa-L-rhamnosidase [Oscillospiraceae bacterium]